MGGHWGGVNIPKIFLVRNWKKCPDLQWKVICPNPPPHQAVVGWGVGWVGQLAKRKEFLASNLLKCSDLQRSVMFTTLPPHGGSGEVCRGSVQKKYFARNYMICPNLHRKPCMPTTSAIRVRSIPEENFCYELKETSRSTQKVVCHNPPSHQVVVGWVVGWLGQYAKKKEFLISNLLKCPDLKRSVMFTSLLPCVCSGGNGGLKLKTLFARNCMKHSDMHKKVNHQLHMMVLGC